VAVCATAQGTTERGMKDAWVVNALAISATTAINDIHDFWRFDMGYTLLCSLFG
jgi:hypothetical protein